MTTAAGAARLVAQIQRVFPEALAPASGYRVVARAMTNDPGDRHVLAAAVVSGAATIITYNLRHFPSEALAPYDMEVLAPDPFLVELFDRHPEALTRVIEDQAGDLRNPPMTVEALMARLEAHAPAFVRRVRHVRGG